MFKKVASVPGLGRDADIHVQETQKISDGFDLQRPFLWCLVTNYENSKTEF